MRSFEVSSHLKALWLSNNKLKENDRKCFEPLKNIEGIELYNNADLYQLSFIKPLTERCIIMIKLKNTN